MRDVRPWTYAALFGTLWGGLEATLGTIVYLGKVPFRGTLMGLAGLLCLICLRRLQPRPGICLLAGAVAVFLKVFTLGGVYPGPIIGISIQALAVELAMTGTGGRRVGAAIGGFLTLASNPLQKLAMTWIVSGSEAARAALDLMARSTEAIGLAGLSSLTIVGGVVMATGLVGAVGGLWSWSVAGRVSERIGGSG